MLNNFDSIKYQQEPYPHMYMDNALDYQIAIGLQEEILNLTLDKFDRYDNPFEQKFTLRDKFSYPEKLNNLFLYLESDNFIDKLSTYTGYKLIKDNTRNFNGVHVYNNGDKLDIHLDAGIHPSMGIKKCVTLGIYLSLNWKENYGCDLEIWEGDKYKLNRCVKKIAPIFNRLILFTCNDYSWHGNPEPANCPENAKRIFVTISYLSNIENNDNFLNNKPKAYFINRPDDLIDLEKDRLRLLRADPILYKEVYRYNNK